MRRILLSLVLSATPLVAEGASPTDTAEATRKEWQALSSSCPELTSLMWARVVLTGRAGFLTTFRNVSDKRLGLTLGPWLIQGSGHAAVYSPVRPAESPAAGGTHSPLVSLAPGEELTPGVFDITYTFPRLESTSHAFVFWSYVVSGPGVPPGCAVTGITYLPQVPPAGIFKR